MKFKLPSLLVMLAFAAMFITSARGQGFLNLNFESAYDLPGDPGKAALVSITNALPGWTAYNGEPIVADALYDVSYVSNNNSVVSPVKLEGGSLALDGNFSVGFIGDGSISQTGLVPTNAESLQFEADSLLSAGNFYVTLGGQSLSYSVLSEGPYAVYEANIPTDMEGQVEALTFGTVGEGETVLDDIEFNVPEPSEFGLVGLGVILFGVFNAKARRRKDSDMWRVTSDEQKTDLLKG